MARKLVVELIADPRGYTAGLQTAAKQTKVFGAEMDKATRGILSGSGALHGLGRSLAFASGGFLAFEGVSRFLEESVSAARDAGVAQRSLAAQIKASGESFSANEGAIQKASLSLEKFGFTSEDSEKALTVLERGTGNITRAINLQGTAADLARAKNIDLASAANVLAKVFGGQETALRRAVPGLDKDAHGMDLVREAAARLAGQAKAGTTETEKFHAILHNTEVIVGTALLPTLNKFLETLGKWLQKMNESGQLQKDVNEVVKDATGIFQAVLAVVKPLAEAFKTLGDAVGGTKNEVQLLAGVFVALKTATIVGELTAVGTAAETSTGKVKTLRTMLGGLRAGGPIAITVAVGFELLTNKGAVDKFMSNLLPSWLGGTNTTSRGDPRLARTFPGLVDQLNKAFPSYQQGGPGGFGGIGAVGNIVNPALGGLSNVGQPRLNIPGTIAGASWFPSRPLTAAQQRAIGLAGDPQNLGLLRQQAAHDQAALDFAKKLRSSGRISNAKYVDEVTHYASDLQQTNSTIAGILQTARQKVADAAKAAAEKQKQAAQAAKDRLQAAREHTVAVAQLAVTRAQATPGYEDDLATQQHLVEILKNQLAADRQNVDLQNKLFDAEQAVKATLKQRADQAAQSKIDAGNLAIQRAQLTDSLADDLAATQKQVGILKAQHASESDIVAAQLAVKSVRDQIAQQHKDAAQQAREAAKQAADEAKQRAKDAADRALAARNTIQFRLLGLGPTGGALVPGLENLRTRSQTIRDAVKGTFLDTPKTGAELDHIAKILAGKFGKVSEGVRAAIDQMYKDIRDKLKSHQGDQTKFRHMSSTAFVDSLGLNLTAGQRRAIEARFTTVGRGGTVPGGSSGQFTGGVHVNGDIHVHGVQNVAELENQITKRAKARAHTRRGT